MSTTETVGAALQKWMIREGIQVGDDIFVSAVDVAFANERRREASAARESSDKDLADHSDLAACEHRASRDVRA